MVRVLLIDDNPQDRFLVLRELGRVVPDFQAEEIADAGQLTRAEAERAEVRERERAARAEAERLYREAQEADRRKDEFLAMLAHELRNPLAPILNAVHLLGQPAVAGRATGELRDMLGRQVRHLARLVDDLLDVSRITRGKIPLRRERVDLARLVRDTAEDHRRG